MMDSESVALVIEGLAKEIRDTKPKVLKMSLERGVVELRGKSAIWREHELDGSVIFELQET